MTRKSPSAAVAAEAASSERSPYQVFEEGEREVVVDKLWRAWRRRTERLWICAKSRPAYEDNRAGAGYG